MSSVLIVGSVAFDTLHLPSGHYARTAGGSALYASFAAAPMSTPHLVGVVGKDFSATHIDALKHKGVDVTGLEICEGHTFHWEGRYADDLRSRDTLKTELNVFADFKPKLSASHQDIAFVMLGNIDPSLQSLVLDQIRKPKWVIADTMNYWIERTPDELKKMLARVDMLVINEEESRQLTGVYQLREVAERIHAMGPRSVVIKQGEYGAMLFDSDGIFSAPAFPLSNVVDPTGAGDSFAGGLLGYLAKVGQTHHAELRRAVMHGSVMASFCVEGVGSKMLQDIDAARLEERYAAFCELARF